MQNLKVGQKVHVGFNAAKWFNECGTITGRVEAVSHDWVIVRLEDGGAYAAIVPREDQTEFLKEVTNDED